MSDNLEDKSEARKREPEPALSGGMQLPCDCTYSCFVARLSAYLAPSQPWRTCTRGWCGSTDHESCSIINTLLRSLYMGKHKWGFVLSPNAQYVCSYAVDGGTHR